MSISISSRAETFPASPIRKLVPLAEGAKARGVHIYHLNIGQPDLPTPPELLAAVRSFELPQVAYSPSAGEADCLDYFVEYYSRLGLPLERSQINVTTGGSEAILFAFLAVASAGDEIVAPEPLYTNYRSIAQMVGVTIVPITTRPEDGYHLPPAAEIEKKIGPRTKAILLCNPNNPTGTVFTDEELERVASIVRKRGLFWISDEVYREFVYGEVSARSALSFQDLAEQVVVVDSVSKRFSACGARVGCIVSRRKDLMEACLRMAQARLSSPTFGQVLTAAARRLAPGYFEETRKEYKNRRDILHNGLNSIPGVFSRCPEGAFYTMARLPIDDADRFASWLLTDFEDAGRSVLMAPAAGFYMTPGLGNDEVRIAYVLKCDDLAASIQVLRVALAKYPGRRS